MSDELTYEEQHELAVKTALDLAFCSDVARFESKFTELETIFNIEADTDTFDHRSSGFEDGADRFACFLANKRSRRFNAIREAAKRVLLEAILHIKD